MANNRSAIRAAVKDLLLNNTDAGDHIYTSRKTALWSDSELPAILIYTNQEPATPSSLQSRQYIRKLELLVEVRVQAADNVDNRVDELLGEIEDQLHTDTSLEGTVISTIQTNTEIRVDSDGEQDIGVGVLTFECQYLA
jgi:hypothetical protein